MRRADRSWDRDIICTYEIALWDNDCSAGKGYTGSHFWDTMPPNEVILVHLFRDMSFWQETHRPSWQVSCGECSLNEVRHWRNLESKIHWFLASKGTVLMVLSNLLCRADHRTTSLSALSNPWHLLQWGLWDIHWPQRLSYQMVLLPRLHVCLCRGLDLILTFTGLNWEKDFKSSSGSVLCEGSRLFESMEQVLSAAEGLGPRT